MNLVGLNVIFVLSSVVFRYLECLNLTDLNLTDLNLTGLNLTGLNLAVLNLVVVVVFLSGVPGSGSCSPC